tara:strand:- start:332 stop:529 length:198 start_codon:yes stop_codon:yes gene_type:complete
MRTYYDDNFGFWEDMQDEEARRFYQYCQEESVEKECEGCGHTVRILPHYGYCNRCADMRESGIEY